MKLFDRLKIGDKVFDRWYKTDWGVGKVVDKKETILTVKYSDREKKYDMTHTNKFLALKNA